MSSSPNEVATGDTAGLPVTVAVSRHISADHADQMLAWIRAGFTLAERFPGFLGAGWVRDSTTSEDWHTLYRFDSPASLADWEASEQRAWWLRSAQGLVAESRKERRTGIEGWFDEPQDQDVEDLSPREKAPPRWKQGVMIWMAFFPLSLLASWLFSRVAPDVALLPRVLTTTVVMTPIMIYLALPQLTRRLEWWLHGRPAPWRR